MAGVRCVGLFVGAFGVAGCGVVPPLPVLPVVSVTVYRVETNGEKVEASIESLPATDVRHGTVGSGRADRGSAE